MKTAETYITQNVMYMARKTMTVPPLDSNHFKMNSPDKVSASRCKVFFTLLSSCLCLVHA